MTPKKSSGEHDTAANVEPRNDAEKQTPVKKPRKVAATAQKTALKTDDGESEPKKKPATRTPRNRTANEAKPGTPSRKNARTKSAVESSPDAAAPPTSESSPADKNKTARKAAAKPPRSRKSATRDSTTPDAATQGAPAQENPGSPQTEMAPKADMPASSLSVKDASPSPAEGAAPKGEPTGKANKAPRGAGRTGTRKRTPPQAGAGAAVTDDAAQSPAVSDVAAPVAAYDAPPAATTDSAATAEAVQTPEEKKSGGRSRRSSGRGRKQRAPTEPGASAPEGAALPPAEANAQEASLSDFPDSFDDLRPEDYFAAQESVETESEEGDRQSAKKRRGRSRRGGRGRKKPQAAGEAATADTAETETAETVTAQADAGEPDFAEADTTDSPDEAETFTEKTQGKEDAGVRSRRKMFVSVLPEEQIEVVITEEGQVQEYYVEMLHQAKTKGNIYKATVHNVDPNLQAAFVSYGVVKNGFLQIDEVHPEYYVTPHDSTKGRKYPPLQKVLKPGQELLVQVVKEPAGTKGAFLTTYLSIPGRFLVLTPGREQIGVSRKVDNEGERARLRDLLEGLSPGPGLGVIVRTVSMGTSKTSLQRDLQFLKRTWKEVRTKGTTEKAPCLIYQEMDLTSRAVRDYLTDAIGEVWIDDEKTAQTVTEIAEALFPRKRNLVRAHKDLSLSLFERFNLQRQLDQIHSREVSLPSGGRLVIDPTEALTAIDINSGRSSGKNNFEDMAYRTNMEAAKMIPLQLRLRDIGGQVVADFIEMRDKSHWREVEKTLRAGMKIDRARYDVGKIGPFGLLEIVRQRLGSSAISISTEPCPCCNGTGVRRNMEWQSQSALRDILRLLRSTQAQNQSSVTYEADQGVAMHLLNHKRQRLLDMEEQYGVRLDIKIRLSTVE